MRNLKKILALVLALVMSFSVMTVSSAAFKDEAKISADYAESVEVLNAIGVFRGDENGKFNPQKNITRAEVAAIIYRITTGDVKDAQAGFYADLNMFSDVAADDWFAGYVNYCASAEIIKGRGNGTFDPQGSITGYDALTMILRAIGYDKNGEFTGEGYTVKVAQIAKERGITDSLKNVALGSAATREVIAEILLNTITVEQVSYTLAFGYSVYANPLQQDASAQKNETLGYENFKLWYSGELTHDVWGVPTYFGWFIDAYGKDKEPNHWKEQTEGYYLITREDAPVVFETNEAVYECDVSAAIGYPYDYRPTNITVNGTPVTWCPEFDGVINPKSTKVEMGAQGRWTRIFYTDEYGYEVVMMDQFLAQINDVTEMVVDRNGHVVTPARAYVTVYDNAIGTEIVWENYYGNYEYVADEFILLYHEADVYGNLVYGGTEYDLYVDLGTPNSLVGKQTAFSRNYDAHIVNEQEYDDALRFYLDEAGLETSDHTWMFDTLGNLIGVIDVPAADTNYCTISAIKWVDAYDKLEFGYALATVTYIDGSQANLKIQQIDGYDLHGIAGEGADYDTQAVSYTTQYNNGVFTNKALYAIGYTRQGGINLIPVDELELAYTTNGVPALRVDEAGLTDWYIGNSTQVLTYGENIYDPAYATYVGVKNVPSFKQGEGKYFAVDKNGDMIADLLFIAWPVAADEDLDDSYDLFFAYEGDALKVTRHLYAGTTWYWTIEGGMVNGEYATVYTYYESVANALEESVGVLVQLTDVDEDEFVEYVNVVDYVAEYNSNRDYFYTANKYEYVTYAGRAAYADTCADGVLVINGSSYDISDAIIIDEAGRTDLEKIVNYDTDAYLWIIYTFKNGDHNGNGHKLALTIYVSSKSCEDLVVEDIVEAMSAAMNGLRFNDPETVDFDVVYTVEDDVTATVIEAVKTYVTENDEVDALDATVYVDTEFDFAAATEDTNVVTFVIRVYKDGVGVRFTVELNIKAVLEAAEDAE